MYHEICISVCTAVFHVTKISEINFMRRISECVPAFNVRFMQDCRFNILRIGLVKLSIDLTTCHMRSLFRTALEDCLNNIKIGGISLIAPFS